MSITQYCSMNSELHFTVALIFNIVMYIMYRLIVVGYSQRLLETHYWGGGVGGRGDGGKPPRSGAPNPPPPTQAGDGPPDNEGPSQ